MELCSDGHEEVCFEGRTCPVCEEMDEIKRLEREIKDLENEVKEIKNGIDVG